MQLTSDDAKIYGFLLSAVLACLAGLRWIFTDKTKVALLEQQLGNIEGKLDALSKTVADALDKGDRRMQKHEDEIKGLQIQAAKTGN